MEAIRRLQSVFQQYRYRFTTERELQKLVVEVAEEQGLDCDREFQLSRSERVDFLIEGSIAMEVKIKGSLNGHLRQLKRYADSPKVSAVVLVATRLFDLPATLSGKPCYCIKVERTIV